ncbi:MAG: hypothetical protein JST54_05755 [Deltaproteobacteria bacterium]|nr:hypothetical protein [Deltaproteobacteria bacterium]
MTEQEMKELLQVVRAEQRKSDRRWLLGGVVALGLSMPGLLAAASITVPHLMQPNTTALASDVNENFATLSTEATRVSNIVQGPGDGSTSNRVLNLAAPIAADDGASKAYVDAAVTGSSVSELTLIGTNTCPTGWTTALTGTAFFSYTQSLTAVQSPAYACFGPDTRINELTAFSALSTAGTSTNPGANPTWVANSSTNGTTTSHTECVICVK